MCGKETLFTQTRFAVCGKETSLIQERFTMCDKGTLWKAPDIWGFLNVKREKDMIERGLYYATEDYGRFVRNTGGEWADSKHRPIVCLLKAAESDDLYWAIPMGKLNHRNAEQKKRLNFYLNLPSRDIRSCYYHVGRTSSKSIFFISDAVPITDKYIDSIHVGGDGKHYIIKNPKLIQELERKLFRILAFENVKNDSFRQHITSLKRRLLAELESDAGNP